MTFLDDILRVKYLYSDFVTNYLHHKGKFLDDSELAKIFQKFITQHPSGLSNSYLEFTSGYSKFFHTVIQTDSGALLCESYTFQSIGAFLYFDLFRGITYNFIPNQCMICNQYFLIQSGRYTTYCENPSPEDETRTCRDIGSRKRYDDKCKNDPVWLAYNRAYKAHYARYMKKKMTVAEFEQWSAWAVEWRGKAENEEISLEEYTKEIKK